MLVFEDICPMLKSECIHFIRGDKELGTLHAYEH